MQNEEELLKHYLESRKNPFRVPEGYFDNFTAELMKKLPEQAKQPVARRVSIRPWLYAAACLFVAVLTTAIYFHAPSTTSEQLPVAAIDSHDSFEEAADYVMMDNQDIYACLINE